jgi:hypothetical protein
LAVAKLVEQLPLGLVLPGRRLEHGGEAAIDV